jgi:hypothetical protein
MNLIILLFLTPFITIKTKECTCNSDAFTLDAGKVKFSLCLIKHHVVKTYGGVEVPLYTGEVDPGTH